MCSRSRLSYIFAMVIAVLVAVLPLVSGCSTQKKLDAIRQNSLSANIQLPAGETKLPELQQGDHPQRDTITIEDLNGNEVIFMRAMKDEETGDMVAAEELEAAVVMARFRNVAERRGEVDLEYQIVVIDSLLDSKWQLRFYPKMYILDDVVDLDPVLITGADFRKGQKRGYEQYEKFLESLSRDSTRFVDERQLEIFLERNIPQIFKYKEDTTWVSDEEFASAFGVTERQAIDHFTNHHLKKVNAKRASRKGKMWTKFVRNPYNSGARLDTVLKTTDGRFVYNYIQTIKTRPKLRKVDIVLEGAIFDQKEKLYNIPNSAPLTFYISSLSTFVDETEHYKLIIIERKAAANTTFNIEFASAKYDINPALAGNGEEIRKIKSTLSSLIQNTVFDLDSIMVSAASSPEGKASYNASLSQKRSESVSSYFHRYMREHVDSLNAELGFMIDEAGKIHKETKFKTVPFLSRNEGENWAMLDKYVLNDTLMTSEDTEHYFTASMRKDLDARELMMRSRPYYKYLRETYYPKLRTVRFDFYLHRKGMVKDTIHSTVLDTNYMEGVQAIKDRDFERAIEILRPYNDYNAAVAFLAMDYNLSAMQILEQVEPRTAQINYMLAILYSRMNRERDAVECYMRSCEQEPSYIHRGNLDPEIAALIKRFNLNAQPEEDDFLF